MFGEKHEKHNMEDNPYQTTIADILNPLPELPGKGTQVIKTPASPANVIEKSFADVSFLVGMLLDKF
jgi:transposase